MSENKESQSNSKQNLKTIKARLSVLGVNNSDLPSFLRKELDELLAEARQRAEATISEAQEKVAERLVKAETTALEKLLKPAHICCALAKVLKSAGVPLQADDPQVPRRKQKQIIAPAEAGS